MWVSSLHQVTQQSWDSNPRSHSRPSLPSTCSSPNRRPLNRLLTCRMAFHGALWTKWVASGRARPASPTSPSQNTPPVPHPWGRRKDEAAGRGPELGGSHLRAAGGGPGRSGLDVHIELAGLLVIEVRVTGGKAGRLRRACATVKGPSRSQHGGLPQLSPQTCPFLLTPFQALHDPISPQLPPWPCHMFLLQVFARVCPALTSKFSFRC